MAFRSDARYRPTKAELAVFVSGVTSMGLEILAVRVVAPQFGSHIYTVGSILTVFLLALSLGYWQGGKRAATASYAEMGWLLLGTAAYVAFVVYAGDLLLTATSTLPLSPRYASVPAVVVLFGPPTYLLGFVSPYAAELSHKRGIGEASGHVYALGTIGSIVGSAATTFVLVPALSVDTIGALFGVALVGTAIWLVHPGLPRRSTATSVLVVLLLVGAVVGTPVDVDHRGEVVYETQTAYQHLEIVDDGDERTMYLDGARHSARDLEDPDRHVFTYTKHFHLPMLVADDVEDVDRVLFVGGGGFTGPQDFADRYDVHVDVVEIDPQVTDAAESYFGLDRDRDDLDVYEADGRQFLAETDRTYDLIVLDAYKQEQVPFHLTTVEFMELVDARLDDDGILYANVISAPRGSGAEFYRAQYATMDAVFPDVYSFRTSETNSVQNVQLVATAEPTNLSTADLHERNDERDLGVDLETAIDRLLAEPDTSDAPVLTDDRGEVDSLLDPMLGQRYVVEETPVDETADAPDEPAAESDDAVSDGPEADPADASEGPALRTPDEPALRTPDEPALRSVGDPGADPPRVVGNAG